MTRPFPMIAVFSILCLFFFECGRVTAGQIRDHEISGEQTREKVKISSNIGLCANVLNLSPSGRRELFELLEPLGKRTLRVTFRWSLIEPAKGDFKWGRTDKMVEDTLAAGQDLLIVLMGAPKWAGGSNSKIGCSPPSSPEDFGRFVKEVVTHYKGKIRHYELWNEPNVPRFWGARRAEPEEYLALLKAGYEAGKGADPNSVFVMGGITRLRQDPAFIKDIFKLGGLDCCDALGVHLYPDSIDSFANQMRALLNEMREMKTTKKVWVTETGWPSREIDMKRLMERLAERGITREMFKKSVVLRRAAGWVYDFTEEEARRAHNVEAREKEYEELGLTEESLLGILKSVTKDRTDNQVRALYKLSSFVEKSPRLEKIFWYQFRDRMDTYAKEANFGLVDVNGHPKKSYRLMAGELDKKYVEDLEKSIAGRENNF